MATPEDEVPECRTGDRLFVQTHYANDASIATDDGERLYRMKNGYIVAADLLVSHTEQKSRERGDLLWPIVFGYRQLIAGRHIQHIRCQ